MSKTPNPQTPDPDSPEFLKWASRLEYPEIADRDNFWDNSITFLDPDKAFIEALARIKQEKTKPTGKLDLRGLYLEKVSEEVTQLTWLKSLALGSNVYQVQDPLADITFLQALPQLQFLSIQNIEATGFNAITHLVDLRCLVATNSQFSGLNIVKHLKKLTVLDLHGTAISELKGLDNLTQLQTLNLSFTKITELKGLDKLTQLQTLDLSYTKITELKGLDNLTQLQTLDLSFNNITELKGLDNLTQLQALFLSNTNIRELPEDLLSKLPLGKLICYDTKIANIPTAILSTSYGDNCLQRIKAYFESLKQGAMPILDLKLMVLGNGQIGKTQICRRLCGLEFDEAVPSTHGILVKQAGFDFTKDEQVSLHLWDFGGQEIYHGTHSLFFNSQQTIFLLLWHPDREDQTVHEVDGMRFRDHPLSYWLEHIKQQNRSSHGPITVIIAQSQCDEPGEGERALPIDKAQLDGINFVKVITSSAKAEGGLDELHTAIRNAIRFQRKNNAQPPVAKSWHRVKQQIEQWICADNAKPESKREHRLLSYQAFVDLCQGKDIVGLDPNLIVADNAIETLLHMLHHSGVVFYRKGLFDNQILLDQSWALNAIYAVFHREKAYSQIKQRGGKFYAEDLGLWLWNEQGYSKREQEQFLGMMESCGVCFSYGRRYDDVKTTYVVPELLPVKTDNAITQALCRSWHSYEQLDTVSIEFKVDMLHTALFSRVLAMVGQQAQSGAVYWQDGLLAFETNFNSWLLFERKMINDFEGTFVFSARCGNAQTLINIIEEQILWQQRQWSVQLIKQEKPTMAPEQPETSAELQFDQTPPQHKLPEVFISYSWREDAKQTVEQFCGLAADKNVHIVRDINALKTGDSISAFMRRIGRGKRIIVVLSKAYLESPNCMFELYEIWRTSANEPQVFRERVKAFALEDAKIYTLPDRLKYASYWKNQFDAIKAVLDEDGATILGEKGYADFERIQQFYLNVNSMLSEIADILAPKDIEALLAYGLDGLELD